MSQNKPLLTLHRSSSTSSHKILPSTAAGTPRISAAASSYSTKRSSHIGLHENFHQQLTIDLKALEGDLLNENRSNFTTGTLKTTTARYGIKSPMSSFRVASQGNKSVRNSVRTVRTTFASPEDKVITQHHDSSFHDDGRPQATLGSEPNLNEATSPTIVTFKNVDTLGDLTSTKTGGISSRRNKKNMKVTVHHELVDPASYYTPIYSSKSKKNLRTIKSLKSLSNLDFVEPVSARLQPKKKMTDREKLFTNISVPTKYEGLEDKLKEYVAGPFFNENRHRSADPRSDEVQPQDEYKLAFNELQVWSHNKNKSGMIWDVRSKANFNEWFEEDVVKKYIQKVDRLHNFIALDAVNDGGVETDEDAHVEKEMPEKKDEAWKEQAARYLSEMQFIVHDNGTTRMHCYHPSSFPPAFHQYLAETKKKMDKEKQLEEEEESRHNSQSSSLIKKHPFMKEEKAPLQTKKVNTTKDKENTTHSVKLKRSANSQPALLRLYEDYRKEDIDYHKSVYKLYEWDGKVETDFLKERHESIMANRTWNIHQLNRASVMNFLRKNKKINQEKNFMEQEINLQKKKHYQLNCTAFKRTKVQKLIDNVDEDTFNNIEFDLANKIIAKHQNDIDMLHKERIKYLKKENEKKKKKIQNFCDRIEKKEMIEAGRKEQRIFSARIRTVLKKNEENEGLGYTKTAKQVAENPKMRTLTRSMSKIPQAIDMIRKVERDAVLHFCPLDKKNKSPKKEKDEELDEEQRKTPDLENGGEHHNLKLGFCGVDIHSKTNIKMKLKRVYTGGPRGSNVPTRPTKEKILWAATKLQSIVRGIIARKKFIMRKDAVEYERNKIAFRRQGTLVA